jgi:hypothetical protein
MCWLRGEPKIDALLSDPVITAMMRRDGVDPDWVRQLLRDVGSARRRGPLSEMSGPRPIDGGRNA